MRSELEEALPRAYLAAIRWLGSREESRDACQEAAAKALGSADRYDPDKPFYPWFYRILKNHCMDRLKRRTRVSAAAEQIEQRERTDRSAEGRLLLEERSKAVTRAVADLPEDLREVIELRHFQDASYEEMAAIIGCPAGTVMSRLYRARRALRAALRAAGDFYETPTGRER